MAKGIALAWLTTSLLCLSACLSASDQPVRLANNVDKLNTEEGAISSTRAPRHLSCVMDSLGVEWRSHHAPWRRARQEVIAGDLDGYFTARRSADMEPYATLSAPLILENWYWFQRRTETLDVSTAKVGALLGSHQSEWLSEQQISVTISANQMTQLVRLLAAERIDLLVADYEDFHLARLQAKLADSDFEASFLGYIPLGVYFRNGFLQQRPFFLRQFNDQIYPCAPKAFELPDYEQALVFELIEPFIEHWRNDPDLVSEVREQNRRHRGISQQTILERDGEWISEFHTGKLDFAQSILQRPLSRRLKAARQSSDGMITEVIVMDEHGTNVAISDLTSDYWQGDEAKFLDTFHRAEDFRLVEPVVFDESTQRFQIQISLPVFDPTTDVAIGAMSIGVNIEQALTQ